MDMEDFPYPQRFHAGWFWESGFDQETITKPISEGIEISREYRNKDNQPVTTAKLGDVTDTLTVTAGETIYVYVGGQSQSSCTGGYNGGGVGTCWDDATSSGGGASVVASSATEDGPGAADLFLQLHSAG